MLPFIFMQGILIGFLIAMPFGPVDLLVIRNSISRGMFFGFITGMGAAVTDGIFGAVAGLGISEITEFLLTYKLYFKYLGGIFLIGIGFTILMSKILEDSSNQIINKDSFFKAFLTSFILTFTNPLTIISFIGIFAALEIELTNRIMDSIALIVGIILGSTLWWIILSCFSSQFKNKIGLKTFLWLNRISGFALITLGIAAFFI
jgi:threonine/homoserine/homoserine lactone efflux protein